MVITHKLAINGTESVIEEPVGFDDLKTKIKRSDLHGMSVELSVGNLEFYGVAFNIIKEAYESDIESQIVYTASTDSGEVIYSGTIDLSTYSEKCGDYCSITCKVGDVGAKTTFNNRVDTDVDLNATKTIDGADLGMQASWNNIKLPLKHLKYTNSAEQKNADEIPVRYAYVTGQYNDVTPFALDNVKVNEFGQLCQNNILFEEGDDFDEVFGSGTTMHVDLSIKVVIEKAIVMIYEGTTARIGVSLKNGSNVLAYTLFPRGFNIGDKISLSYNGTISTDQPLTLHFREMHQADILQWDVAISIVPKESYVKMTMYDNLQDSGVSADMLPVHNALNVITGAISENALSVKSDWFGGWLSSWNMPTSAGGGHLKAITNGYKIRGLFTEGDTERNMPVSFKSMINSLNALDCIGWGFSRENGADVVRVERWNWFYKDDVILHLAGADELERSVDVDNIITDIQIGFKKYETTSQFNSIDSVHGERSMTNAIKVVSKKISQLCNFIGDTYCIEETRRAKEQVDPTESFKYDENIFIFELGYKGNLDYHNPPAPYIPNNVVSSSGVDRPAEQYNVQLSPRRCAERWRSFLFASRNRTPYRFISGKINYKAIFACNTDHSTASYLDAYLEDYMGGQQLAEDAQIEYSQPIFKAELLKFTYPITLEQYKGIMANPYGQIEIDGIYGWIKEMQYSFATGEAEFTLIPKF